MLCFPIHFIPYSSMYNLIIHTEYPTFASQTKHPI